MLSAGTPGAHPESGFGCSKFVRSVCGLFRFEVFAVSGHTHDACTRHAHAPPRGARAARAARSGSRTNAINLNTRTSRDAHQASRNAIMHQGSGIACVWPPAPEAHHRWGTRCLVLTIPTPTTSSSRQPVRPKRLRSYSCSGNTDGILAVVRCGPASREGIPNKKGRCDRVGAMVKSVNAG